jgi:ribosome modulation factor
MMKTASAHLGAFAGELRACYDEGVRDGAAGKAMDECRFRVQSKRSAWETGWHEGRRRAAEPVATAPTEEEAARAAPHLAALRARMAEHLKPFWAVKFHRIDVVEHLFLPTEGGRSACQELYWLAGATPCQPDRPTTRCQRCAALEDRYG